MKVYDTEGKEHEKDGVDVRECVNVLGWSTEKPEGKKEAEKAPAKRKVKES